MKVLALILSLTCIPGVQATPPHTHTPPPPHITQEAAELSDPELDTQPEPTPINGHSYNRVFGNTLFEETMQRQQQQQQAGYPGSHTNAGDSDGDEEPDGCSAADDGGTEAGASPHTVFVGANRGSAQRESSSAWGADRQLSGRGSRSGIAAASALASTQPWPSGGGNGSVVPGVAVGGSGGGGHEWEESNVRSSRTSRLGGGLGGPVFGRGDRDSMGGGASPSFRRGESSNFNGWVGQQVSVCVSNGVGIAWREA